MVTSSVPETQAAPHTAVAPHTSDLAPVVDDLSIYLVSGRLQSRPPEDPRTGRSPAQGIADGVLAEKLGFSRVYIAERYDFKEAGAFLGGVAALTSRIGLGTGAIAALSRTPLQMAGLGQTLHACYGPRFALGLGRTVPELYGVPTATYQAFEDYAGILRQLWRGETVNYNGPAGKYEKLRIADPFDGPAPKIYACVLGGPKGCASVARAFDGAMLTPFLTPAAVGKIVRRIHDECEKIGRDPAEVRICHPIVTAPDCDDYETRLLCHARAVTYFQMKGYFDLYDKLNEWNAPDFAERLRNHDQLKNVFSADAAFHRKDLLGPASLIPDQWVADTCGIGSSANCVATLRKFREAGADEITLYGSTPERNAGLIAAWREQAKVNPLK